MKLAVRSLILLAVLGSAFAHAQIQGVQNVIVLMQENRTPDDLFQDPVLKANGADIVQIGTGGKCGNTSVALNPRPLADCANPNHNHDVGWLPSYDSGKMDGACTTTVGYSFPCPPSAGPYMCPTNSNNATDCTEYAYVSDPAIAPYWQIAEDYGFANYMFQTSQGPSFPAHQFLLSGTSAPDSHEPNHTYFAAENTPLNQDAGCAASLRALVPLVDPSGVESTSVYPGFEHPTLTDLLDSNSPTPIPWRWYSDKANSIWTAPNAISHICNNNTSGGSCGSSQTGSQDWKNNVAPYLELATRTGYTPTLAPFLQDLQNCNFPATGSVGGVYFVVPDGKWSDHASKNIGLGPDYVANIVNLIGRSATQGACPSPMPNWNNTVLLITWDDWGGWYDHVSPSGPDGPGIGYLNNTGGQYVYGFRVPLLVVSTFAKQHYISSPIGGTLIKHDFGSILRFIEESFLPPTIIGINPTYPYADQFVGAGQNVSDLSDFFDCSGQQCNLHPFQKITLVNNSQLCSQSICKSNQCDATCFINYPGGHTDPDDE